MAERPHRHSMTNWRDANKRCRPSTGPDQFPPAPRISTRRASGKNDAPERRRTGLLPAPECSHLGVRLSRAGLPRWIGGSASCSIELVKTLRSAGVSLSRFTDGYLAFAACERSGEGRDPSHADPRHDDALRRGPPVPRPARHLHRRHLRRWRLPLNPCPAFGATSHTGGTERRTSDLGANHSTPPRHHGRSERDHSHSGFWARSFSTAEKETRPDAVVTRIGTSASTSDGWASVNRPWCRSGGAAKEWRIRYARPHPPRHRPFVAAVTMLSP